MDVNDNFLESIKSWNCLPLIQKTWIAFNTHFREAHLELTETRELTLKESGYGQENIVDGIVSHLSAEFQYQGNMVNSAPPEYPAPQISGMAELLQQILVQNQELMRLLFAKDGKSGRMKTSRPLTSSTGPRQGQPRNPMPANFDKYFWMNGQGSHKGDN